MEPTPEIARMVREQLARWQDSDVFMQLHGLVQANIFSATVVASGGRGVPPPDVLRREAADLRCVVDGLARFLEGLADRIEAGSN